jgi:hypothetical protein
MDAMTVGDTNGGGNFIGEWASRLTSTVSHARTHHASAATPLGNPKIIHYVMIVAKNGVTVMAAPSRDGLESLPYPRLRKRRTAASTKSPWLR